MENLDQYKIVFYLALALLYFILKGRKKKPVTHSALPEQQQKEAQVSRPSKPVIRQQKTFGHTKTLPQQKSAPASSDPFSLEDILKEFGIPAGEGKPKPPVVPEKNIQKTPPKYKKLVDYEEDLRDEEDNISKPVMKDNDREKKEMFQPYEQEHKIQNEYAALFKDPDSLKKVFIAQEIFRPKHF